MVYLQYFNQILTVVLEVLDDSDSSVRELALSLIVEMLKNQVRTWHGTSSLSRSRSYIKLGENSKFVKYKIVIMIERSYPIIFVRYRKWVTRL